MKTILLSPDRLLSCPLLGGGWTTTEVLGRGEWRGERSRGEGGERDRSRRLRMGVSQK
jgi:hypothetical protein